MNGGGGRTKPVQQAVRLVPVGIDVLPAGFPAKNDSACPRVSDGIPADLKGWILDSIDVVVFAGGISPQLEGEEMPVSVPGFSGGDRTSIALPAIQGQILKALHDAGKKVVLVNFSGSAIGLEEEAQWCDAILQAWYPGQEGGTAVADVLYGDVNPSGKLPVTFYKDVSQLPDVEDYNMEGHTYRYFRGEPQWPFGFGLSYTTFRPRRGARCSPWRPGWRGNWRA